MCLTKIVVTTRVLFFNESATSSIVSTYFLVMLMPLAEVQVPICSIKEYLLSDWWTIDTQYYRTLTVAHSLFTYYIVNHLHLRNTRFETFTLLLFVSILFMAKLHPVSRKHFIVYSILRQKSKIYQIFYFLTYKQRGEASHSLHEYK